MKKFFKKTEGFTLVELIVVIAILGILAGVGTVGYSGYIKKANEAADKTLLAAASTAINVAAVENRVQAADLAGAEILLNEDGTVDTTNGPLDLSNTAAYRAKNSVTRAVSAAETFEAAVNADFSAGFACTGIKFKVYTDVIFNGSSFEGYGEDTYEIFGTKVNISAADVAALKKSGFNSENLGATGLTEKMADVTDFTGAILGSRADVQAIITKPAFLAFAGEALGMEDTPTQAELETYVGTLAGGDAAKASEITSRALVLFAADQASSADKDAVMTMLKNGTVVADVKALRDAGKNDEALTQAALAYGMYVAYANNNGLSSTTEDPLTALGYINKDNEGFMAYLEENQSSIDLDGFIGGLNIISDATKDPTAVNGLLTSADGFQDAELLSILTGALG